jgi:acetyl esterase/lipase
MLDLRVARFVVASSLLCGLMPTFAAVPTTYTRTEDVIYGRKYGMALTLDVFTPKEHANGAAVVFAVSGGFASAHEFINGNSYEQLLNRGYTIFAVVHGSKPAFTVPEILEDMYRAVRFIRHNAQRFHIDPDRIGASGVSSGGHLSLMLGLAAPIGKADANDPIDRESSRVNAVACFFPPTDFMNWGRPGRDLIQALEVELVAHKPPFDFREEDPQTHQLVLITDRERRLKIVREISPVNHVTPDATPTLIIHGDADKLVPIQQAKVFEDRMREAKAPFKLVVKPGADHGWPDMLKDMTTLADWFDKYLPAHQTSSGAPSSKPSPASP